MKYRYKVLIINMIVISIALSLSGLILMSRNNSMMLDAQVKNAVVENNLAQSVIEYSLLDVINSGSGIARRLPKISDDVSAGMLQGTSDLYVRYNDTILFHTGASADIPSKLFENPDGIRKNYIISHTNDELFIYVTSFGQVGGKGLNIITRRNITDTEQLMNRNIHEYMLFTILILILSGLLVYVISYLLTRPLENLNRVTDEFADGNFSVRSSIHSGDEVGLLSDKFNDMAASVEEHIEELNDMLHRRDQFVADFTHEIKTPMTAIIGYADTIRSVDLTREEQINAAGYIFSEGKRLEQMSMKLFDLLYIKDHHIEKTTCNASTLGKDVVISVSPILKESKIQLEYHFENAAIICEAGLIKTVLINLIDNARKASEESSVIEVTGAVISNVTVITKATDNYDAVHSSAACVLSKNVYADSYSTSEDNINDTLCYEFTVTDHGIGIPQEDIARICDEFYMVDKSRSRNKGGAGLGLSLASIILQEHSSKLEIESEVGKGTRMSFKLQLVCA